MNVYVLSNMVSAFADAGMFFLMFEAFLRRRNSLSIVVYIIGYLCLVTSIYICNYFLMYDFVNVLGMLVLAILASSLYLGNFWKRLLAITITLLIGLIFEMLVVYLVIFNVQVNISGMILSPDYRLLGVIISKISSLAICNIVRVQRQRKNFEISKDYWLIFFLLFFSFLSVTFLLFRLSYALDSTTYNAEVVFCTFCLFLCIAFSLFLYERQTRQSVALREKEQYEQQLKYQLKHLDDLLAKQNELRKFKHDIDHQMSGLRGYLQAGDAAGGMQHLDAITNRLTAITPDFDTGNIALDAILSTKKTLAEAQGIAFSAKLNIEEHLPIAPEDICTIFGNALDNAIEACQRLDDGQQKSIEVSMVQIDTTLLCKIINSASEQTTSGLATTKQDKENHGFGIANLTESLARYDSVPEIDWEQGQFILRFILPFTENK